MLSPKLGFINPNIEKSGRHPADGGSFRRPTDLDPTTFRQLGTQLLQLPLKRLDLAGSLLVTCLRGRVSLALGVQFAL